MTDGQRQKWGFDKHGYQDLGKSGTAALASSQTLFKVRTAGP